MHTERRRRTGGSGEGCGSATRTGACRATCLRPPPCEMELWPQRPCTVTSSARTSVSRFRCTSLKREHRSWDIKKEGDLSDNRQLKEQVKKQRASSKYGVCKTANGNAPRSHQDRDKTVGGTTAGKGDKRGSLARDQVFWNE